MENLQNLSNNQRFWEANHGRLSEAVFRIRDELPGHSYRDVAEQEIAELREEAMAAGLSEDEFTALCGEAYMNQWYGEHGESYIETEAGDATYNGTWAVTIGEGQLPADQTQSADFLVKSSRVL